MDILKEENPIISRLDDGLGLPDEIVLGGDPIKCFVGGNNLTSQSEHVDTQSKMSVHFRNIAADHSGRIDDETQVIDITKVYTYDAGLKLKAFLGGQLIGETAEFIKSDVFGQNNEIVLDIPQVNLSIFDRI